MNYLDRGASPGPEILDAPGRLPVPGPGRLPGARVPGPGDAPGRAPQPPAGPVLARWAPAILGSLAAAPGAPARTRSACSGRLVEAAPQELPGLVDRLILGLLAARAWPGTLEPLDAVFDDAISDTLTGRLDDAAAAIAEVVAEAGPSPGQQGGQLLDQRLHFLRRTLTVMVALLARHGHAAGITAARAMIADAAAPGADAAAVHAARPPRSAWSTATRHCGKGSPPRSAARPACCARSCGTWPTTPRR